MRKMSTQGSISMSPAIILKKRYLRILRDTVRRELDNQLIKHLDLLQQHNFLRYLSVLKIPSAISDHENAWQAAKSAVEQCKAIDDWFNLEEFWKSQRAAFIRKHGVAHYQALLAKLMVRLHGFWVFTLDDTNHTFRFVPVASECNEWERLDGAKRENPAN